MEHIRLDAMDAHPALPIVMLDSNQMPVTYHGKKTYYESLASS